MDYQAEWERIHSVLFNYFQCGGVLYEEVMPDLLGRPLIEGVPAIAKKYFELKKQVEHYKKIAEARQGEFNELRKRLKVPESEWVTPYVRDALDELDRAKRDKAIRESGNRTGEVLQLRAELDAVKAERDRYHTERDDARQEQDNLIYQRNDFRHWHANEQKKVADLTAELAALRQRDAMPVKVRFSCTAKELANVMRGRVRFEDCAQEAMDYLTSHAVIDAPAGVPSVQELVEIARDTYCWRAKGECEWTPVATAIRDAVLAGVAGEEDYCKMSEGLVKALSDYGLLVTQNRKYEYSLRPINAAPTPPPTAAQVEALARAIKQWMGDHPASGWDGIARAAFAHIGRVPLGAELDVHPDQLELYKWVTMPDGGYTYAAQQAIDLCRSRIKPVYECKECAKAWPLADGYVARINAARAALEGE